MKRHIITIVILLGLVTIAVVGGLAVYASPAAASSFGPVIHYAVGSAPVGAAVGDFDGDDVKDLATANASSSDSSISILLGNGDGTLAAPLRRAVAGWPVGIAVGDFNRDGRQDLVTANYGADTISFLPGNGDGTFGTTSTQSTGSGPWSIAVGDFNSDGKQDLVTGNRTTNSVSVMLGLGDGTFAGPVQYGTGVDPWDVAVGDFNGDGKQDLVTANFGGPIATVLLGNGNGTFGAAIHAWPGTGNTAVAVGDLNSDGKQDVAVANAASNSVLVLDGAGDGTFAFPAQHSVGESPMSVAIGDLDGNGRDDLAVANVDGNSVSVLLRRGLSSFDAAENLTYVDGPSSVVVADFDADGQQDLAVADGDSDTASVILSQRDAGFVWTGSWAVGAYPLSLAVGDWDDDGWRDVATVNRDEDTITLLQGSQTGGFHPPWGGAPATYGVGGYPSRIAVGDFNGDSRRDLVTSDSVDDTVSVLLSSGTGVFAAAVPYGAGDCPVEIAVGDFDRDGRQDLAVANYLGCSISVLRGKGDGTFYPKSDVFLGWGYQCRAVAVGDFNRDGKQDLAVASGGADTVGILQGDGAGGFTILSPFHIVGNSTTDIAVGDFNGDGKQDMVTANSGAGTVSVLLGNGSGGLAAPTDYAAGGCDSVAVGDFDRDGHQDLAAGSWVLRGRGDGTFARGEYYPTATGHTGRSVHVADFNNDGWQDLVSASPSDNIIDLRLGTGFFPLSGTMTLDGGAAWTRSATVTVTSNVAGATQMRLREPDGQWDPWQSYSSNARWTMPPGDGRRDVQVLYRNGGGYELLLDGIIRLDTTAPTTTDDAPDGWQTAYMPVTVTFTPTDTGSGMSGGQAKTEYKFEGDAGWTTGTSMDVSSNGHHTLYYRSTDMVGNVEEVRSCTVDIDWDAPITTAHGVDDQWHNSPQFVWFTVSDYGSGMVGGSAKTEYNLDGAGWTRGDWIVVLGDGDHTLQYHSTDAAGNVESVQPAHVKIDATAPATTDDSAFALWTNGPATVTLTADDGGGSGMTSGLAKIEYSTDGGTTWTPAAGVATTSVTVNPDPVAHTTDALQLLYRSTDALGNLEATKSCTVRIDTRGPTTSGQKLSVRRGRKATFNIRITDPQPGSPDAHDLRIKIKNSRGRVVKTLTAPGVGFSTNEATTFVWPKCTLARGTYTYKVYATDQAGNRQVWAGGNRLIVR